MAEFGALHRSRPVRVAYLVEDGEFANLVLDAVFAECRTRWAGRFSLIVPFGNGEPVGRYENWLQVYDPDIIYSYIGLDERQIEAFHRKLCPSYLIRHRLYREDDAHSIDTYWPRLPFNGLSSLSLVPLAAMRRRIDRPKPLRVLDYPLSSPRDPFIEDSFGSFGGSFRRWPFPRDLWESGRAITVAPPKSLTTENLEDETVPDVLALLHEMSNSEIWTLEHLSAMSAGRVELNDSQWSRSFSLFIGDSFADRVVYWNSRFHFPNWRDNMTLSLRIPVQQMESPEFLNAVARFLTRRNYVSGHGSGGPPYVTIRTSSLPDSHIAAVRDALSKADRWGQYLTTRIENVEACVPSDAALKRASMRASRVHLQNSWRKGAYAGPELTIEPALPEHMRMAPRAVASKEDGIWAVDLAIERALDHSPYDNVRQSWHLPRSLRMTRAFSRGYQLADSTGPIVMPRVDGAGHLTMYALLDQALPAIGIPDDEAAFAEAFVAGRDWWPFVRTSGEQMPSQICKSVRVSENGRYFSGVLGLFGGLANATQILLHRLWFEQFELAGASSRSANSRVTSVSELLAKRFSKGSKIDTENASDMDRISRIVLAEARRQRLFASTWKWSVLREAHKKLQDEHWTKNPPHKDIDADEWREGEYQSFVRCVQDLCGAGVLHQGIEWKCRDCFHKNWVSVNDLKQQIICEVCSRRDAAPIEGGWQFRINEFLATALREHGVLALVWAIKKVRGLREDSFFYQGPTDLFFDRPYWEQNKADCEIDLTCVSDGLVRLCEVKHSSRSLDLDRFVRATNRVRPDIATLAIMEPASKDTDELFSRMRSAFADTGIQCELKTFDASDLDDTPTFGLRSFSIM